MTEQTTKAPTRGVGEPVAAPADTKESEAVGYAVYDRHLGQYVTPVTKAKPSDTDARKAVTEGHSHRIVRV